MTDGAARRRQWAWHVSALGYRWSYLRITHRADADLFAFLGGRISGARVLDGGCGPGVLSEKLASRSAAHVLAVDANPSMVRQARMRLAPCVAAGVVEVRQGFVDASFFDGLDGVFDIVVFKRSLYASHAASVAMLRAALAAVGPRGLVVVVHPERSLRRYAFGSPPRWRRHSTFHLFNRAISVVAALLRISEYRTYTRAELLDLLAQAAPAGRVEAVATSQHAYNIVALGAIDQPPNGSGAW